MSEYVGKYTIVYIKALDHANFNEWDEIDDELRAPDYVEVVGEVIDEERLARIIDNYRKLGCRNVNLVGGEPTIWAYHWFQVFKYVKENIPIVWNSNAYYSLELAKLLTGFVDVYLLDFKYGKNDCAVKISNAPNYVEVCQRNHLYALNHGELIIRILVLPQHVDCCTKPILKWIAENLGTWVRVNLMDQYRPEWKAYEIPELRRRLIPSEFREAVNYAKSLGIKPVELNFDSAIRTMTRMYARRGKKPSDVEVELMRKIFELTSEERSEFGVKKGVFSFRKV